MADALRLRWAFLMVFAVGGAAFAILVPAVTEAAPDDAARDGTARFDYEVTAFSFTGRGSVLGGRETQGACVAGVTSTISGSAAVSPADVPAPKLGEGDLTIGRKDTIGIVRAGDFFDFDLKGTYEESTACEDGLTAMSSRTPCNSVVTSKVIADGLIKGGVGDTVRITWTISQDQVAGGWFPNFVCVASASFEERECRSPKISLSNLTKRKIKLPFTCEVRLTTAPPAGKGYDRYEAFSQISGFVRLKTDRR